MDRHDVGIVETRRGAGFAAEPLLVIRVLGEVRQQHLQRDGSVDGGVVGTPHLAHAAAAQQLDQLIAAKRRALHRLTITSEPLNIRSKFGNDYADAARAFSSSSANVSSSRSGS